METKQKKTQHKAIRWKETFSCCLAICYLSLLLYIICMFSMLCVSVHFFPILLLTPWIVFWFVVAIQITFLVTKFRICAMHCLRMFFWAVSLFTIRIQISIIFLSCLYTIYPFSFSIFFLFIHIFRFSLVPIFYCCVNSFAFDLNRNQNC